MPRRLRERPASEPLAANRKLIAKMREERRGDEWNGKGKGMNEFWTNTNLEPWRLDGPRISEQYATDLEQEKRGPKESFANCYLLFFLRNALIFNLVGLVSHVFTKPRSDDGL